MPPGTVMDLYEHYKATQSLLGGHCISYFGCASVLFACQNQRKSSLFICKFQSYWVNFLMLFITQVRDISWCLREALEWDSEVQRSESFHKLRSMHSSEGPTEWQGFEYGAKTWGFEVVPKPPPFPVLWQNCYLATPIRISWPYKWDTAHFNWWTWPKQVCIATGTWIAQQCSAEPSIEIFKLCLSFFKKWWCWWIGWTREWTKEIICHHICCTKGKARAPTTENPWGMGLWIHLEHLYHGWVSSTWFIHNSGDTLTDNWGCH